eukprot:m.206948 g.206948  ORF g.206948 m.206948 type:complete len:92 (-) comp25375_c0_seq6:450-725(-)
MTHQDIFGIFRPSLGVTVGRALPRWHTCPHPAVAACHVASRELVNPPAMTTTVPSTNVPTRQNDYLLPTVVVLLEMIRRAAGSRRSRLPPG